MALILYFAAAALLFGVAGLVLVVVRLVVLDRHLSASLEGVRS